LSSKPHAGQSAFYGIGAAVIGVIAIKGLMKEHFNLQVSAQQGFVVIWESS
jgi:hypothetical protein